jgi:hypothetical protein
MLNLKAGLFFLALVVLLTGCVSAPLPPPVKVIRFNPVISSPQITTFVEPRINETYIRYNSTDYVITSAVFESQSLLLAPLNITNNTSRNIEPDEYAVSLHDGRDLKKVKMLKRDDLIAIKTKIEGVSSGGNIETQVFNNVMDSVMSITNNTEKQKLIQGLHTAINNYFSFRPIYSRETRSGILCFMLDFKAEYPLTLRVMIRDKAIDLQFLPAPDKAD